MISPLEKILQECYPEEDSVVAYELICSFEFDKIFDSCILRINDKFKSELKEIDQFGVIQLGGVAASLLVGINEKIRVIKKDQLPDNLEQVLADVSVAVFEKILLSTKSDKGKLIEQISYSLHDTCSIHGYNEEELHRFLRFDGLVRYASVLLKGEGSAIDFPKVKSGYTWKGNNSKKQAFISLMSEYDLVRGKSKSYYDLFDPEKAKSSLKIDFNPDKSRLIMTFFFLAKNEYRCLSASKGGFYEPLLFHGIDFQNKILEKRSPREFNDMLRKNKKEWNINKARIDKWVDGIIPR